MISLNNVGSAGAALQYFSADNYYTQDEGLQHSQWFGKGASSLGLNGQIDRGAFFALLQGKVEGVELGRWVRDSKTGEAAREHRPGLDITFSAPKSVSLLAEVLGRPEVRQAHEEAVTKALGYIEASLAQTRFTEGAETITVRTDNLIVGLFRHNTSRDLDPQTHTHAVVMNATRREDGQWRSLSNDAIYGSQRLIGAIYTSELAERIQALGYAIERVDDKGNFEIAGITREQIEHLSQRRADIATSHEARGIRLDEATAEQKEEATLRTRAHKKAVDHADLLGSWEQRAQEIGLDLGRIQAEADKKRTDADLRPPGRVTGLQAMEFATAHLIEREVVVPGRDLLAVAIEHGAGRVSASEVQQAFIEMERSGALVQLPEGDYTTRKMLSSERWALEQIRQQKGQTPSIMSAPAISERLVQQERRPGFRFTEGQIEAVSKVLTSSDQFVAVQGLAGTGKTTMLRALREIAQEQGYVVRGMAPTGAASKVLRRETGIASDTVAMFQIRERKLRSDLEFARRYAPDFQRKPELWIVDESSFLAQRQKARLDYAALKAGAKVVYLGDSLQLQGVEAGKPFELAQKHGIETAFMTEISRQKNPELKQAVDIMTGLDQLGPGERLTQVQLRSNARAFEHLDRTGHIHEVNGGKQALVDAVVKEIVDLGPTERARTLVITPFNEERKALNEGIRDGLKARGELPEREETHTILVSKGWTRAKQKHAQYYRKGDVVRFGRDYQSISVLKGEYARVDSIEAHSGVVRLLKRDGSSLEWRPAQHTKVEVFEAEKRDLAVGDLIRMTRSEEDFKNGEVARVKAAEGPYVALEWQRGSQGSTSRLDLARHQHWDHAYASTVHAAQGSTQHRTVLLIRNPKNLGESHQLQGIERMAKIFGDRSFYVGVTRASHELKIFTDDKAGARRSVALPQDKGSALQILNPDHPSERTFSYPQEISSSSLGVRQDRGR